MNQTIKFYLDCPENEGKRPLSTNIKQMSWDTDSEFPLLVEFFTGKGMYAYKVREITCPYDDAVVGETYGKYYERKYGSINDVWSALSDGALWSKEDAKRGEKSGSDGRRSVGAAFDSLIKKPVGFNRNLYKII